MVNSEMVNIKPNLQLALNKDEKKAINKLFSYLPDDSVFSLSYNPNSTNHARNTGTLQIIGKQILSNKETYLFCKIVGGSTIESKNSRGDIHIPELSGLPFELFIGDSYTSTSGRQKNGRMIIVKFKIQDLLSTLVYKQLEGSKKIKSEEK